MSKQTLNKHVEPYRMADQGVVLKGDLPVSAFTRLCEGLSSHEGDVQITLKFGVGEDGFREVVGEAAGIEYLRENRYACPGRGAYSVDSNEWFRHTKYCKDIY